jgi:hypothetical protein
MGGHWSAIRFFEGLIDRHFPQRDFWPGAVFECPATQEEAAIAIAISPHRETLPELPGTDPHAAILDYFCIADNPGVGQTTQYEGDLSQRVLCHYKLPRTGLARFA